MALQSYGGRKDSVTVTVSDIASPPPRPSGRARLIAPGQGIDRRGARGQLGAAAKARAEARRLGLGRPMEEQATVAPGRPGRTDRPAVDAGGRHPDEEDAVEARVAGQDGAVTGLWI